MKSSVYIKSILKELNISRNVSGSEDVIFCVNGHHNVIMGLGDQRDNKILRDIFPYLYVCDMAGILSDGSAVNDGICLVNSVSLENALLSVKGEVARVYYKSDYEGFFVGSEIDNTSLSVHAEDVNGFLKSMVDEVLETIFPRPKWEKDTHILFV